MSKKADKYDWIVGQSPPIIDAHSLVKHKIVERYLERYIKAVMCNPNIERLKISVVDGFAGGGEYLSIDNDETHEGSPLLAMRTIRETEAHLNIGRKKARTVDARFYFIEKKSSTFEYLSKLLAIRGYHSRIGKDIFQYNSAFAEILPKIIQQIKNHQGGERAVFC